MKERRENVRVPCRLEIETGTGEKWFVIESKNIGIDGMMLSTELDIKKIKKLGIDIEKKVFLSFYLPLPIQSELIKVSGKIVYIEKKVDSMNKKEISFIGIQFENLSEYYKKLLRDFILGKGKKITI